MNVTESYGAVPLAADVDAVIAGGLGSIGGYLCTTAGSIKLTWDTAGGATIVNTMAVTAGIFYPVPMAIPPNKNVFCTQTGGAAGTWFVN